MLGGITYYTQIERICELKDIGNYLNVDREKEINIQRTFLKDERLEGERENEKEVIFEELMIEN